MTRIEALRKARDLIAKPECWTQDSVWALDADESPVHPNSPKAVQWSVTGACHAATESDQDLVRDCFVSLALEIPDHPRPVYDTRIGEFTDAEDTDHADVVGLFDRAIETLEVGKRQVAAAASVIQKRKSSERLESLRRLAAERASRRPPSLFSRK